MAAIAPIHTFLESCFQESTLEATGSFPTQQNVKARNSPERGLIPVATAYNNLSLNVNLSNLGSEQVTLPFPAYYLHN